MTAQSRPSQLQRSSNELLEATSFLSAANAAYIEALYAQWQENLDSVEPSWAAWFAELGGSRQPPGNFNRMPDWHHVLPSGTDAELVGALTGLWPPRKGEV